MTGRFISVIAVAGLLAFCWGCSLYEPGQAKQPPVHLPESFTNQSENAVPTTAGRLERWWLMFNDANLNALMERALADNLRIKSAWARLDAANATAVQAGAALSPEVNATATGRRARVDRPTARSPSTGNFFTFGLAASYELDLWHRVRATRSAAAMDALASREDLDSAAMSLAGSVAETWFGLIEQREQLQLLESQLAVGRKFLELTELRFAQGQASALDVYQQRQQVAATKKEIPRARSQLQTFDRQLKALLGGPPRFKPPESEGLPALPALPGTGVPADLLERRPDVRAAFYRLEAADHRVAAAVADRLPALRLTAAVDRQGVDVPDLFRNWTWNLAGSLTAPLFDGSRRKVAVEAARAAVREKVYTYGQTVLDAMTEVEIALAQERQQHLFLGDLDEQIAAAERTLKEARARYLNGQSDYLPVLTALQGLQALQRQRVTAHRQLLTLRVGLCRSLGGSWTKDLKPTVKMSELYSSGDAR